MSMPDTDSVNELFGWRRLALWPVGLVARLWVGSLRLEMSPEEQRTMERQDRPAAFILWHNRLFLGPAIYRRYRAAKPLHALISASQDGAWLSAFFSLMGMRSVRGSSSRLGREALTGLVEVVRAGHDVGITPDGPRGPCYDFKPGALIVARRTGCLALLVGGEFTSAWRVRSWDGFYLPKPFSRVRIRCLDASDELGAERDDAAEKIAARLREINPD